MTGRPPRARFIRSGLLQAYAAAAKSFGIDPYRMLRRARLPVVALDQPELRVPEERVQRLISDTASAAGSEEFALVVGANFKLSMMGALGRLVAVQPTVRLAAEALRRYTRYQSESVEIYLDPDGKSLDFVPILLSRRARASSLMAELCVAVYVETFRALLGEDWLPRQVWLTSPVPSDRSRYQRQLGPTEFNAAFSGFSLSGQDLALSPPAANAEAAGQLELELEARGPAPGVSVSDIVSAMILHLLPRGHCGVDDVARGLGVDRRTIHRRLSAEGVSFTELLEAARREVASEQLRHGDLRLGEVTARVGFSSLSAFSRWFRHAYGVQPSEYRRLSHDA